MRAGAPLHGRAPGSGAAAPGRARHAVWARGFRPFFLGVGAYGALAILVWTTIWLGGLPAPAWLAPAWWHAHEMLFGTVSGAVAGFLLTATPVWAGRPATAGAPLVALVLLWALGRGAMWLAGVLPAPLVASVDVAFLPILAAVLARTLRGTGQIRNHAVVALVAALALANAAVHADAVGLASGSAPRALRFAVDAAVVLMVVIGGRITPAFTANALRRAGSAAEVRSRLWLDRLAVAAVALLAAADLAVPGTAWTGAIACAAGLALAARMSGWQTRRTLRDPLLWSLHAGAAWIVAGLLLVAAGDLGAPIPPTAGLHALTAGAMGALILAVMTRVGLGHTGRPLVLPRRAVWTYALVHAGALLRVASAFATGDAARLLLLAAGALWAAAFALFALVYRPILTRPRVDGAEG
jgi:uncharacterized protein involved in response to NO